MSLNKSSQLNASQWTNLVRDFLPFYHWTWKWINCYKQVLLLWLWEPGCLTGFDVGPQRGKLSCHKVAMANLSGICCKKKKKIGKLHKVQTHVLQISKKYMIFSIIFYQFDSMLALIFHSQKQLASWPDKGMIKSNLYFTIFGKSLAGVSLGIGLGLC